MNSKTAKLLGKYARFLADEKLKKDKATPGTKVPIGATPSPAMIDQAKGDLLRWWDQLPHRAKGRARRRIRQHLGLT